MDTRGRPSVLLQWGEGLASERFANQKALPAWERSPAPWEPLRLYYCPRRSLSACFISPPPSPGLTPFRAWGRERKGSRGARLSVGLLI